MWRYFRKPSSRSHPFEISSNYISLMIKHDCVFTHYGKVVESLSPSHMWYYLPLLLNKCLNIYSMEKFTFFVCLCGKRNELRSDVEEEEGLNAENAQICASNVVAKFTFHSHWDIDGVCGTKAASCEMYAKRQPNRSAYKIDFKFTVWMQKRRK